MKPEGVLQCADYAQCGGQDGQPPEIMGRVLGIVYRVIARRLVRKAGYAHNMARTGAVTLIQRFGSALNLNIHFHMLFLGGIYIDTRYLPVPLTLSCIGRYWG